MTVLARKSSWRRVKCTTVRPLVVQWNCNIFTRYKNIGSIQLQGVRMETFERPTEKKLDTSVFDSPVLLLLPTFTLLSPFFRPNWYSLILKLDMTQKALGLGRDRLIKLRFLSPGLIVGFWRVSNTKTDLFTQVILPYIISN